MSGTIHGKAKPALLAVADGSSRQFVDAAAIERPSTIAVIERNDNTAVGPIQTVDTDQKREDRVPPLADILRAVLIRVAAVVRKLDVADGLAIVAKKHAASLAQAFMDFRVTRPSKA